MKKGGNPQNLKPFKKGQSGNPKGRPKKLPKLDELLAEVLGTESKGKTIAENILRSLQKQAMKGNVKAAELLLDRAYGKAKQSLDVSGDLNLNVSDTKFTIKTKGKQ